MLTFTLELNGGLNHEMFLLRFLLLGNGRVNLIFLLEPLVLSALLKSGAALSNHFLLHEILEIILLIMAGIDGGWFDCL